MAMEAPPLAANESTEYGENYIPLNVRITQIGAKWKTKLKIGETSWPPISFGAVSVTGLGLWQLLVRVTAICRRCQSER